MGLREILIILLVILLLFGAKKLPELARSVGRSMRIFKSEVKEMGDDGKAEEEKSQPKANDESFWESPENQPRQLEQPQPDIAPKEQQNKQNQQ